MEGLEQQISNYLLTHFTCLGNVPNQVVYLNESHSLANDARRPSVLATLTATLAFSCKKNKHKDTLETLSVSRSLIKYVDFVLEDLKQLMSWKSLLHPKK